MRLRALMALVLALSLLCAPALAGFSPGLDALGSRLAGGAYQLSLSATLDTWPDLDPRSLSALQGWLEKARLDLVIQQEDAFSQAALWQEDQQLLTLQTRGLDDQAWLALATPWMPPVSYVGPVDSPPGHTLLGLGPWLMDPHQAAQAAQALAREALPGLLPYEKPVKTALSIKNAGRGASQLVYALKAEEAQAYWATHAPRLLPRLEALLQALLPARAAWIGEALSTLSPDGALTLKRVLDQAGEDLGLQLTGNISLLGRRHRLTLFGGWSATGGYLSLKLPAARGNDTFELQLSLARQDNRLKADWRFREVAGKDRHSASGTLDLKSVAQEGGERLHGSLTAHSQRTLAGTRSKRDFTLKPELYLKEGALSGTLDISQQVDGRLARALTLSLQGQPHGPLTPLEAMSEIALHQAEESLVALERARVQTALLPALKGFLLALPDEVRYLVLHDIGRERRALELSGVAPLADTDGPFTVMPEDGINPPKEEHP